MKTTTKIVKHFLKLYYLNLATDSQISFQKLEAKSNKGEEISAGDFCFGYIDRGYENLTEIRFVSMQFFQFSLPKKEGMCIKCQKLFLTSLILPMV